MAATSIEFTWNENLLQTEFIDEADEALIKTCINVALYAKIDPPYVTGRYSNSIKVAAPSYAGDDFEEATMRDLLVTDVEALRDEIQGHELAVGSYLPYSYWVQTNARNPEQRYNLIQAADAVGKQEDYDYNLYQVMKSHGRR